MEEDGLDTSLTEYRYSPCYTTHSIEPFEANEREGKLVLSFACRNRYTWDI